MPSGSKKRKAAKKKKEQQAHNNSSTNPSHGNDNLKSHDEKESDGGEVSSPVSQDQHHHHHHPLDQGEDKKEDTPSVRSFVAQSKSTEGVTGNRGDEVAVEVVHEMRIEEGSERENVSVEHIESAKESSRGSSGDDGSSSSSSSDDEKKPGEEAAPVNKSVDPVVSSLEETTGEASCLVVKIASAVDSESAPVENPVTSDTVNLGSKGNTDEVLPVSNETVNVSSSGASFTSKENEDKLLPPSDVPSARIVNVAEHIKDSEEIPECSENKPLVASAPRTMQTTSWKSCCGLFEVLTGSNR